MGCHHQSGDHLEAHRKGFILVQVLSRYHYLTRRYGLLNWCLFSSFLNLVNFQSSVAPKPMHKCTSLEAAVLLLSSNASLSFIACWVELQLLKVPSSRSCLSHSGFNLLLPRINLSSAPQIHRSSRVLSQLSADRVWRSYKL